MTADPNTTAAPTQDQLEMAHCAIRYCLGRMTYIVADGCRWARQYAPYSEWFRDMVIRDIESAESRGALGMDCDARAWRAVLADLKQMERV